jgi:sec-independent protein translocase protein TatB
MFDFAWSEIALIAVVALIAIGPKDMPAAIRAVTDMVKKARRMAAEFQTHVDEMVREADLHEVRASINEIRNFDIRGEIERTVDPDGTIRETFSSNPLEPTAAVTPVEEIAVSEPAAAEPVVPEAGEPAPAAEPVVEAPAFIPPNVELPPELRARAQTAADAAAEEPPAFIPPEIVLQRRSSLAV